MKDAWIRPPHSSAVSMILTKPLWVYNPISTTYLTLCYSIVTINLRYILNIESSTPHTFNHYLNKTYCVSTKQLLFRSRVSIIRLFSWDLCIERLMTSFQVSVYHPETNRVSRANSKWESISNGSVWCASLKHSGLRYFSCTSKF